MDIFTEKETRLVKISPNKHLRNSLLVIYYMGLWPDQTKYKYLYNLYAACSFVFLLGISVVSEFMYIIINRGNVEIMMASATLMMTYFTYALKVICIVHRHKRIKDLIDITNNEMFTRDNDKYERIVTHYTRKGIFHHIVYQIFGCMTVISWGCTPILQLLNGTSKQLPMAGWYPYNVTSTPAFELTSLHQFIVVFISCINNVAIDTFITGLMITSCCQLTLLSHNISSIYCATGKELVISNSNISADKSSKAYNESYEDLKLCIVHSIMIFDFSKQIQDIFGTAIFCQLLVDCIIVCLTAFNISQMKNYVPSELFGTLMYMCCMIYQIFIYCWHGNELYLHSMNVCFFAYMNNWWNNSKNFRQALLLLMTRVQWPLILTAGNIMELSLQNFVLILRTSYSIFSVLKTSTNT